ncbi:hypothetical protein CONPUDRAFT_135063 [Coniophora puteana RWD-64-598 SS2]|uniref:NYN domain-containing protein n=1 Tax=Coniophora puteana (strain RWD-64-598) TaxID=741705 RepID=A0A5M3N1S2_CONPW|nr:uncharacterized protein CONPUDRAFT_135063 [Coniophora puteana RWD-64-598 SS2]EIW85256.1 hypothetical protein CONPUDRAFT_135063 [Coniophora puteana RWD-64-598 SS2]
MPPSHSVAIFWDYENCSPPANAPGNDLVHRIRRMAHVFGGVTTFKAYTGLSDPCSSKTSKMRSELQSSGVSLIDCPHNNRKDVVDKMILVDMLAFAIDNSPEDATIVLISGDRDYAYAVSTLRLRQYRVVLIAPPISSPSLCQQASIIIDWDVAVLAKRSPASFEEPVRQRYMDEDRERVSNLSNLARNFAGDSSARPASNPVTPPSKPRRLSARELLRPCFGTTPSAPAQTLTTRGADDVSSQPQQHPPPKPPAPTPHRCRSASQPGQRPVVSPGVQVNSQEMTPTSEALNRGYPSPIRIQPDSEVLKSSSTPPEGARVSTDPRSEHPTFAVAKPITLAADQALSSFDFTMGKDSVERWSQLLPDASLPQGCRTADEEVTDQHLSASVETDIATPPRNATPPADPTPLSFNSCRSELYYMAREFEPTSSTAQPFQSSVHVEHEAPEVVVTEGHGNSAPSSFDASVQSTPAAYGVRELPDASHFDILLKHLRLKLREGQVRVLRSYLAACMAVHRPVLEAAGVPDLKFSKYVKLAAQLSLVNIGGENMESWVSLHPSQMTDEDLELAAAENIAAKYQARLAATHSPFAALHSAPMRKSRMQVPKQLLPLYDILSRAHESGMEQPSRTDVAVQLMKLKPTAYTDAGVTSFKDYAALAEKANLVVLGLQKTHAWMCLQPQWRGLGTDHGGSPAPAVTWPINQAGMSSFSNRAYSTGPLSTNSPMSTHSSLSTSQACSSSDGVSPPFAPRIPAAFEPLVVCLRQLRANGELQPLRSRIGALLTPNVYTNAGTAGFKEYISSAEAASMVQLGGYGGTAWVALHPSRI